MHTAEHPRMLRSKNKLCDVTSRHACTTILSDSSRDIMSVLCSLGYVLAAVASSSPPPSPLCSPSSVVHECLYAGKVGLSQLRNFSCPDTGGLAACADSCCHQCNLLPACQAWTVWGPGGRQKAKDNKCFLTHNNPGGPAPGTPGIPACLSGEQQCLESIFLICLEIIFFYILIRV